MSSDPVIVHAPLVLAERRRLAERDPHPADARARMGAFMAKGTRAFKRLWTAGEPSRAQLLAALRPAEAATLVGPVTRAAGAIAAEPERVGGSTPTRPQEDQP